ncbi:MAG: transporter [Longimicrobiales bacterium]
MHLGTPGKIGYAMFSTALLFAAASPGSVSAQDLEARTYQNAPVGFNFLLVGYAFSHGNILVDPALPVEEGTANLHTIVPRYVRTLSLGGLSAKLNAWIPFTTGDFEGIVQGEQAMTSRSNFGDPRFELSVALLGAPALAAQDFRTYRQRTVLGASVQVTAPLGEYDSTKLVNLGSNRWSFRPQVGVSHALGPLVLDAYGSVWLFGDNPDSGGQTLAQSAIYVLQANISYTIRPGAWVAVQGGYAEGGRTTVGGVRRGDLQQNTRLGLTASLPLAPRHGLKLLLATGIATRIGADFNSFGVAYQYTWGR